MRLKYWIPCFGMLVMSVGIVAFSAQEVPVRPVPSQTRDNFSPKSGILPRLTPEQLDRETKAAEAKEATLDTPKARVTERKAAQGRVASRLAPQFRLTRDVAADHQHLATSTASRFQITLKNAFVEKYKNRVTITTQFRVVHASKVHAAEDDGDQHVAGLAEEVGLPCVAEIMNAKFFKGAVEAVAAAEESEEPVSVTGAWRLWCEHPGKHPQIQDDVIPAYKNSNPDHVFEIHPVSSFGPIKLQSSLTSIEGYEPKEARRAFTYYESLPCEIVPESDDQTTTIFTVKAQFNYVEFKLRLDEDDQYLTLDGRIVRGSALTLDDKEVAHNRRLIFIKNSAPEKAVRDKPKGTVLHVLGIPRIDLALVSWRARNAETHPEALTWNLPYEVLVVGVYDN